MADDEKEYPRYFKCVANHSDKGMIVEFTSIDSGTVVEAAEKGTHKLGIVGNWVSHTYKKHWEETFNPNEDLLEFDL